MIDSFAPINPALIDVVLPEPSGYSDLRKADDTTDACKEACGAASRDFPKDLWIEPKDWPDRARDNSKYGTWGLNYIDRYTNQGAGGGGYSTHECTCHSLITNCLAANNRQRGIIYPDGPKADFRYAESAIRSLWLSALSVYIEANPSQWGGANVRQVLEIACRRGILPDKTQPREYWFKHTLHGTCGKGGKNQSRGPWVRLSQLPEGWQDTAKWFKPVEVIFPDSWEQAVCLVLHGMLVSVGRNGHAVPWGFLTFEGDNLRNAGYPDSYDETRYDSAATIKRAWSGSFAVATMTTPDDFLNPAGTLAI